jgi:hypothetical protein
MLATFETDNGDLIVRARNSLPSADARLKYRHMISIRWPYEPAPGCNVPNAATEEMMDELAEALGVLANAEGSAEAASITGFGMREWRFYTDNPEHFMVEFNRALAECDPFPIELEAFEDPEWNGLREFLPTTN